MLRTDSNLVIKHVGSDIFGENSRNKILCLTIDSPERAYFVSGDKYFGVGFDGKCLIEGLGSNRSGAHFTAQVKLPLGQYLAGGCLAHDERSNPNFIALVGDLGTSKDLTLRVYPIINDSIVGDGKKIDGIEPIKYRGEGEDRRDHMVPVHYLGEGRVAILSHPNLVFIKLDSTLSNGEVGAVMSKNTEAQTYFPNWQRSDCHSVLEWTDKGFFKIELSEKKGVSPRVNPLPIKDALGFVTTPTGELFVYNDSKQLFHESHGLLNKVNARNDHPLLGLAARRLGGAAGNANIFEFVSVDWNSQAGAYQLVVERRTFIYNPSNIDQTSNREVVKCKVPTGLSSIELIDNRGKYLLKGRDFVGIFDTSKI